MIQVTFFTLCTLILMQIKRFLHPRVVGRTTTKDIFHPSHRLESCGREVGTSSGTSEGPKPSGSPVGPTVGPLPKSEPPTIFIRSRSVSKPEFDHHSLVGRTFFLPPEEMGRNLTSTSLMAYRKYYFNIEDGFSNSKSNQAIWKFIHSS